jgi:hypothetical protein
MYTTDTYNDGGRLTGHFMTRNVLQERFLGRIARGKRGASDVGYVNRCFWPGFASYHKGFEGFSIEIHLLRV